MPRTGPLQEYHEASRSSGPRSESSLSRMIPADHVHALMRTSTVSSIDPIEGWSTTVEEAKSFGALMILSDIEVHREQTDGTSCYSASTTPRRRQITFRCFSVAAEPTSPRLLPNLDQRVRAFATEIAQAVKTRCPSLSSARELLDCNSIDRPAFRHPRELRRRCVAL